MSMSREETTVMDAETSLRNFLEQKIEERTLSDDQEAFMVGDSGEVAKKHQQFRKNLPNVKPFYAVKCNDRKEVIDTLAKLGTGFDCASQGEIELVLGLGVSADRIIYANPCKQLSHIKYADRNGVRMMTLDDEQELTKVAQWHPTARMLLRIKTDGSKSFGHLSSKFGASLERGRHLLEVARDLGVAVVGVSFHVGSPCQDMSRYTQAIVDAHVVFKIGTELGHHMQILDIGGGFPGTDDAQPTFEEIAAEITSALHMYFPEGCGVEIVAEPGRFYVATAFTLALNVIAKKEIMETTGDSVCIEKKCMYFLNDGIFGSLFYVLYDEYFLKPIVMKKVCTTAPTYHSTLWGQTLSGLDKIMDHVKLPLLQVGDWLVFRNVGAYSTCVRTTFNGFAPTPIYFLPHKQI